MAVVQAEEPPSVDSVAFFRKPVERLLHLHLETKGALQEVAKTRDEWNYWCRHCQGCMGRAGCGRRTGQRLHSYVCSRARLHWGRRWQGKLTVPCERGKSTRAETVRSISSSSIRTDPRPNAYARGSLWWLLTDDLDGKLHCNFDDGAMSFRWKGIDRVVFKGRDSAILDWAVSDYAKKTVPAGERVPLQQQFFADHVNVQRTVWESGL